MNKHGKNGSGWCESKDLTGLVVEMLTFQSFSHRKKGHDYWICKCECGNVKVMASYYILRGNSKSCGCHRESCKVKHGLYRTRIYKIYRSMISRCYNGSQDKYKHWGGKGITVCGEWLSDFVNFYNWSMANGYTDKLTIDRKDNSKGYSPDNCRWTTMMKQQQNRTNSLLVEINGEVKCLTDWANTSGITRSTISTRYYRGFRGSDLLRPLNVHVRR